MPVTPQQPSGHTEGLPEPTAEAAVWVVIPCGPCIPIMLGLASLTAFFIITTAVLAERLFRRPQPDPSQRAPTLVWRPGGELWIEPTSSARERSEDCSLVPQTPPEVPAQSTFWRPQTQEERPHDTSLVSWVGSEPMPEAGLQVGSPRPWRPRQGSLEPDWGLQPRVTLEQISAFWKREGRTSVGF